MQLASDSNNDHSTVPNERVPPQVTHISERGPLVARPRPLKRMFAMLGMSHLVPIVRYIVDRFLRSTDINEAIFPKCRAPKRVASRSVVSELLEKLDARVRPGITVAELKRIIAMCERGLITTQRAFDDHDCRNDLTGND